VSVPRAAGQSCRWPLCRPAARAGTTFFGAAPRLAGEEDRWAALRFETRSAIVRARRQVQSTECAESPRDFAPDSTGFEP
jgi:hypothetical protein